MVLPKTIRTLHWRKHVLFDLLPCCIRLRSILTDEDQDDDADDDCMMVMMIMMVMMTVMVMVMVMIIIIISSC